MTKKIFITGTGTDIGKTYVSALIVKKMREQGYSCGYYKPVLSGVVQKNGELVESDCNYVVNTASLPCSANDCVTYWWEEAVSPHLASERAEQEIDIEKIKQDYNKKLKQFEFLLIEGAGGITCPLKLKSEKKYLMKDLIKDLGLNIIIVADGGLGTINSVLLTTEYAKQNNLKVEGIILNNYNPDNFMYQDNLKQVEFLTGIKVITTVVKNQTDIDILKDYFK